MRHDRMLTCLFVRPPADIDRDLQLSPGSPQRDTDSVAGRNRRNGPDQAARAVNFIAVDRQHHVARPNAGFRGRSVAVQAGDGNPAVPLIHRNSEPSAFDRAFGEKLGNDAADCLAGYRKANADRSTGGRDDHRTDADHLSVHVEDRTAGVAGIDWSVQLKKIVEWAGAQVAALGGDDADRYRTTEAEWVAGGQNPVPDLRFA